MTVLDWSEIVMRLGAAALIGSLDVTRATRSFDAAQLGIYNLQAEQMLTPEITLIGSNYDRDKVLPGETVLLSMFWQARHKLFGLFGSKIF